MDWDAVEKVLYNMHCRACDGYQCDHGDRVAEALAELKEIAAQQSVQRTADGACENCGNNCWKLVCETCGAE